MARTPQYVYRAASVSGWSPIPAFKEERLRTTLAQAAYEVPDG